MGASATVPLKQTSAFYGSGKLASIRENLEQHPDAAKLSSRQLIGRHTGWH
jgi:hypothetical protein